MEGVNAVVAAPLVTECNLAITSLTGKFSAPEWVGLLSDYFFCLLKVLNLCGFYHLMPAAFFCVSLSFVINFLSVSISVSPCSTQ